MTPCFAVRMEVLKAALADKETCAKIEAAESWSEFQRILEEFAKKQGFEVAYV